MLKEKICKDLYEEIERLERSIIELEDEIIELKAQLRAKTEEVTSLAIENQNLRYKLERLKKTHEQLIEMLKKMNFPIIIINENEDE
ncbi:MAG: DUF972 family protein [Thermococcus sp.]|uniref:initiation control protein YabA n=1 Tax=Thermococcus sp. TaxID=35749 RepID=UPI000F29CFFA|nr:initiation control protein YabA [Thermococcus sp.]MBO8174040.1 DUF972 family protein [Thermococcus sp.]RLJ09443.1 MAG: hypothetical protein DRP15_03770 [Candidatus Aenigmarchaeota archaeon]